MDREEGQLGLGPLYAEHLVLGASFQEGDVVARYQLEGEGLPHVPAAGAYLSDVSGLLTLVASGADATSFATAAFAGPALDVGACGFQAVLSGDGGVCSVPLLARTGTSEYVAFDLSPRAAVVDAWLQFLSNVSQDGFSPYANMALEDASATHAALALWGPGAQAVLGDYTRQSALPGPGRIASCALDSISCIVARPVIGSCRHAYLLLVPPASARVLWRSLLSFTEVTPVGRRHLEASLAHALSWYARLRTTDALRIPPHELASAGLVRAEGGFVGARGL